MPGLSVASSPSQGQPCKNAGPCSSQRNMEISKEMCTKIASEKNGPFDPPNITIITAAEYPSGCFKTTAEKFRFNLGGYGTHINDDHKGKISRVCCKEPKYDPCTGITCGTGGECKHALSKDTDFMPIHVGDGTHVDEFTSWVPNDYGFELVNTKHTYKSAETYCKNKKKIVAYANDRIPASKFPDGDIWVGTDTKNKGGQKYKYSDGTTVNDAAWKSSTAIPTYSSSQCISANKSPDYKFLFNGCPRHSTAHAPEYKYFGDVSKKICQQKCTDDPKCTMMEVTGCLNNDDCTGGNCNIFYGDKTQPIINGGCRTDGDQKAYQKIVGYTVRECANPNITRKFACMDDPKKTVAVCPPCGSDNYVEHKSRLDPEPGKKRTNKKTAAECAKACDSKNTCKAFHYEWSDRSRILAHKPEECKVPMTETQCRVEAQDEKLKFESWDDNHPEKHNWPSGCFKRHYSNPVANADPGKNYKFLFNGCPRYASDNDTPKWKYFEGVGKKVCQKICTEDPKCTGLEIQGCLNSAECTGGNCNIYHGDVSRKLKNGGCVTNGDMKAYQKIFAPPSFVYNRSGYGRTDVEPSKNYKFLFDGCPRLDSVVGPGHRVPKYVLLENVNKKICQQRCNEDPKCAMMQITGCKNDAECKGGTCAILYADLSKNKIYNGGCDTSGDQKAYLKILAHPEGGEQTKNYNYLFNGCGRPHSKYVFSDKTRDNCNQEDNANNKCPNVPLGQQKEMTKKRCQQKCSDDPECIHISVSGCLNDESKEMKSYGQGNCNSGYYAGWDGIGTASQEACNELCMTEPQCNYASWKTGTCSRYKGSSCTLMNPGDHFTFAKTGTNDEECKGGACNLLYQDGNKKGISNGGCDTSGDLRSYQRILPGIAHLKDVISNFNSSTRYCKASRECRLLTGQNKPTGPIGSQETTCISKKLERMYHRTCEEKTASTESKEPASTDGVFDEPELEVTTSSTAKKYTRTAWWAFRTRAIGAYRDEGNSRAMRHRVFGGPWTEQTCASACANYKYFGLQYNATDCFCENNLNHATKYGTWDSWYKREGWKQKYRAQNIPRKCNKKGGPYCNYIYETMGPMQATGPSSWATKPDCNNAKDPKIYWNGCFHGPTMKTSTKNEKKCKEDCENDATCDAYLMSDANTCHLGERPKNDETVKIFASCKSHANQSWWGNVKRGVGFVDGKNEPYTKVLHKGITDNQNTGFFNEYWKSDKPIKLKECEEKCTEDAKCDAYTMDNDHTDGICKLGTVEKNATMSFNCSKSFLDVRGMPAIGYGGVKASTIGNAYDERGRKGGRSEPTGTCYSKNPNDLKRCAKLITRQECGHPNQQNKCAWDPSTDNYFNTEKNCERMPGNNGACPCKNTGCDCGKRGSAPYVGGNLNHIPCLDRGPTMQYDVRYCRKGCDNDDNGDHKGIKTRGQGKGWNIRHGGNRDRYKSRYTDNPSGYVDVAGKGKMYGNRSENLHYHKASLVSGVVHELGDGARDYENRVTYEWDARCCLGNHHRNPGNYYCPLKTNTPNGEYCQKVLRDTYKDEADHAKLGPTTSFCARPENFNQAIQDNADGCIEWCKDASTHKNKWLKGSRKDKLKKPSEHTVCNQAVHEYCKVNPYATLKYKYKKPEDYDELTTLCEPIQREQSIGTKTKEEAFSIAEKACTEDYPSCGGFLYDSATKKLTFCKYGEFRSTKKILNKTTTVVTQQRTAMEPNSSNPKLAEDPRLCKCLQGGPLDEGMPPAMVAAFKFAGGKQCWWNGCKSGTNPHHLVDSVTGFRTDCTKQNLSMCNMSNVDVTAKCSGNMQPGSSCMKTVMIEQNCDIPLPQEEEDKPKVSSTPSPSAPPGPAPPGPAPPGPATTGPAPPGPAPPGPAAECGFVCKTQKLCIIL